MNPMGGTEILAQNLFFRINPEDYGVNLIVSNQTPIIKPDMKNVYWLHHNVEQGPSQALEGIYDQLDAVVYVSDWQLEHYRRVFNPKSTVKSYVIKNAISPIAYTPKEGKVKLIYTSTPWRGLHILLDSFERLDRDVELDIYSSTAIYGKQFQEKEEPNFAPLFEWAKSMKNVNYYGYATNDEVREAVKKAHIFAYPSTFEETSCLSMIEAGAAGCTLVSTNLGAIPETACNWATLVPIQTSIEDMVTRYTAALQNAIDTWQENPEQAKFFNLNYSWDTRVVQWKELLSSL